MGLEPVLGRSRWEGFGQWELLVQKPWGMGRAWQEGGSLGQPWGQHVYPGLRKSAVPLSHPRVSVFQQRWGVVDGVPLVDLEKGLADLSL